MKRTFILLCISSLCFTACDTPQKVNEDVSLKKDKILSDGTISYSFSEPSTEMEFQINVAETGRYRIKIFGSWEDEPIWLEDYIENKDERTYDITGKQTMTAEGYSLADGSPLQAGEHQLRLHNPSSSDIDSIHFQIIQSHTETSEFYTQSMQGEEWHLVWSDEFNYEGLPDNSKWNYNIGNWGWGNNELQTYTLKNINNASVKDGNLTIRALKDEDGNWTSARLTTQGRAAFTYGKIEFRAKVPTGRGSWAAGWLLGDSYKDEISWPYCGEIDVLECVGFEIDNATGDGINHATCHTRKYYFKQGNQIGSEINVKDMENSFHTYGIEWDSLEVRAYLDDEHFFTYDKNQDELEWPFHQPHNIIVNLAFGGGWGGAQGIDSSLTQQEYVLDYIRVYEKR